MLFAWGQPLTEILLSIVSSVVGIADMNHHGRCLLRWVLDNFLPLLASNCAPQSVFQVAGITEIGYCTWHLCVLKVLLY
jgi:hypothetical protein